MSKKPKPFNPIRFTFVRQHGKVVDCTTNSQALNHFLDVVKMSRAHNTWLNYAHDLKVFFEVVCKTPEAVDRSDCLAFIGHQQRLGRAQATINRRLAAVSALFHELQLLYPTRELRNPVHPGQAKKNHYPRKASLYRREAQRLPTLIPDPDLQAFFEALSTWRDRTLVLLMWISCLRVSEAVAIRFEDIDAGRRSIRITIAKGNHPRVAFMERYTFTALNRYLDEERRDLFPEVPEIFVAFKGQARGRPLTVNAVQKMVRYYGQQCELAGLHPHLFRHVGITQLVQQKMPEAAIRQLVGHRRPESLLPYLHLGDDFVASEFERAQASLSLTTRLQLQAGGAP